MNLVSTFEGGFMPKVSELIRPPGPPRYKRQVHDGEDSRPADDYKLSRSIRPEQVDREATLKALRGEN